MTRFCRLILVLFLGCVPALVLAQTSGMHPIHTHGLPVGEVGQTRLAHGGGGVASYYQPVRFLAPAGTHLALAAEGNFAPPQAAPYISGLRIGAVYRFCVTQIPFYPGREVYPTLELIDRIYPPRGRELEFPILVELTQNDLELALEGKFVTKVVFLENPSSAIAEVQRADENTTIDIRPGIDPLMVADTLGRPMAILRLGGRVPSGRAEEFAAFLLGCPAWLEIGMQPSGTPFFREHVTPVERSGLKHAALPYQPMVLRQDATSVLR